MKAKVILAIPGYRTAFSKAAGAADQVIVEAVQAQVLSGVVRPIGMNIHQARNSVFVDAAKSDATHVFFMDDDVVPPAHVIEKLLSAFVGVVGGCYPVRIDGHKRCAAWHWRNDGAASLFPWDPSNRGYVTVGGVGTGCMLVSIDVVRHMLDVYKTPFQSPDEHHADQGIVNVSDDVFFANRLREQGIPVLLNRDVVCRHYGVVEFGEESMP